MNTFNKIKGLCDARDISIAALAQGTGIRNSVFTELKMGRTKTLSVKTLGKIADYFGVPMSYLTDETDSQETDEMTKKRIMIYELTQKASEEDLDALLTLIQNLTKKGL